MSHLPAATLAGMDVPGPTARLLLRPMTDDDLDDMAALLGDPVVMAHYPRPRTRTEAQAWIDRTRRSYRDHGFGLWVLVDRVTGEFVGDCGLTVQHVDGVDELEVGYHVRPDRQGEGLATEAALAARDFAREVLGATRLIAIIAPQNVASQRVASKIGLGVEKRARYGADQREVLVHAGVP
ncbi:GNAT family N-acetyltransferase [Cellulomonas sp. KH9]|uniref:GNAT family N-acetyltransferase n=1 Tax=Cellulomonas sp. KH9 TaxID=1855324 RepID=UPI00210092CA|nr:GNAT family N-acetyltransferase [Cellulomonas sp. KH9]